MAAAIFPEKFFFQVLLTSLAPSSISVLRDAWAYGGG